MSIYIYLKHKGKAKRRPPQAVAWKSLAQVAYNFLSFRLISSLVAAATSSVHCACHQIVAFQKLNGTKIENHSGLMSWLLLVNSYQNHSEIRTRGILFSFEKSEKMYHSLYVRMFHSRILKCLCDVFTGIFL